MKNLLPRLALLLIVSAFFALSTVFAGKAKPLFNGEDLSGWEIVNDGQFVAEGGLLRINKGTGWLRSVDTFGDYTLTMEFRFLEPDANSGIFVRTGPTSKDGPDGWPDNGYQIQCRDTLKGAHIGALIPYGAPPFESVSSREKTTEAFRPMGEWHTFEINCVGETISVKLNGELITLAIGIKNLDGHVGIQGENGILEFRSIEIEEL